MSKKILWHLRDYTFIQHGEYAFELIGPHGFGGEVWVDDGFINYGSLPFQPIPKTVRARIDKSVKALTGAE